MRLSQTLMLVIVAISAIGVVAETAEKKKWLICMFVVAGVLFLISWAMTAHA